MEYSHVGSNRNETWTDEKHVHFLNSMETWFVRTMLDRFNPRLDRHLPDSSDSTLDSTSDKSRSKMKKSMGDKRSSHPHDSSPDQVVPQIEK